MSETTEAYLKALVALSGNPVLVDLRHDLIEKLDVDNLKAVVERLLSVESENAALEPASLDSISIPQNLGTQSAPSSRSSVVQARNRKSHNNSPGSRTSTVHEYRRRVRRNPKVVIPYRKSTQTRHTLQRARKFPINASQALLVDDGDLSSSDSSIQPKHLSAESMLDELSMDELMADTPKRISKKVVAPREKLQYIGWVFWVVQEDQGGRWLPFAEFPRTVQASFVSKFQAEHLTKKCHLDHYAQMLRSRHRFVKRDRCVGNVTHLNRNEDSTWKKADSDKERTCDTCFNRGRFCARIVNTPCGLQLGFYPLPGFARLSSTWSDLQYWARVKSVER